MDRRTTLQKVPITGRDHITDYSNEYQRIHTAMDGLGDPGRIDEDYQRTLANRRRC